MRASLVWERLLVEGRRIVTSNEIAGLSEFVSRDGADVIDYLQQNGYIVRILRGIFYVMSMDERGRGKYDHSLHEMVAMALERKGVANWYYGLETALKFNAMTHEYFMIDHVLTDSYRTTKVIRIMNADFEFIRRGRWSFERGITREGGIRYSDPERTVLDIAYRSYLRTGDETLYLAPLREYRDVVDRARLRGHLGIYPPRFRERVGGEV
ncbi:MAG: type IV toxin-antitoxin system AbiEi family antitoxin [Thermoplasmata archaeon]|nr:type IV toxin-antitoxin system AbiEi family antitoxin [Thermoplasmata archaeon]